MWQLESLSAKQRAEAAKQVDAELRKRGYDPEQIVLEEEVAQDFSITSGVGVTFDDLWIRTKDERLVRFEPNKVQESYLDEICPDWRSGKYDLNGKRELILKARQFGFSTLIEALLFCKTLNTPFTSTVVMAHDAESTENLFRMVGLFFEHLPESKKPKTKYASVRQFYWHELGSSFAVGTAGSKGFGRSRTVNHVHCSEVAFYQDAKQIMLGLLQAVPKSGSVWLESTANGMGDYFHREFELAEKDQSAFRSRFYAWFEHDEYQRDPGPDFVPTKDEEKLQRRHSLSLGQVAWYRDKAKELKEEVVQEYPSNSREAFLSSGNPYFDRNRLDSLKDDCKDPVACTVPERLIKLSAARQFLKVWKLPKEGRRYVIGADPSEGLTNSGDTDFCSAHVIDQKTWEVVAVLHGKWETHEFGQMLGELGRWYNMALIGVERNNHGHAVLNALIHAYGYPLQSESQGWGGVYCHQDFDQQIEEDKRKPGWPTTTKTKFFALDALATAFAEDDLSPNDTETVEQCMTFVKMPGGKAGGEAGSHDDLVISLSIATALLNTEHSGSDPQDMVA